MAFLETAAQLTENVLVVAALRCTACAQTFQFAPVLQTTHLHSPLQSPYSSTSNLNPQHTSPPFKRLHRLSPYLNRNSATLTPFALTKSSMLTTVQHKALKYQQTHHTNTMNEVSFKILTSVILASEFPQKVITTLCFIMCLQTTTTCKIIMIYAGNTLMKVWVWLMQTLRIPMTGCIITITAIILTLQTRTIGRIL